MAADGATFDQTKPLKPTDGEALSQQLEQARSDMRALAELAGQTAADTARDVSAYAEHAAAGLSDDAKALYDAARTRAVDGAEQVQSAARQNPLLFAGGALALGMILGAALRK